VFTSSYFLIDTLIFNVITPIFSGLQKYNIFPKKKEICIDFIFVMQK